MGDQFEKFIMDNQSAFDEAEPSNELWHKIEKKLRKKKPGFRLTWKAAAVLFLISTIALLINQINIDSKGPELSQEFVDAEDYYVSMINQRKEFIKKELTPEYEEVFLLEINQLDSMYKELKKTYQTNSSSERVVNAMISNLQLRLDILNRQLEILENIKEKTDETESIIEI
ncbi:MAG: hypothetical protein AAGC64_06980 [Bacteroidota bacterium]